MTNHDSKRVIVMHKKKLSQFLGIWEDTANSEYKRQLKIQNGETKTMQDA